MVVVTSGLILCCDGVGFTQNFLIYLNKFIHDALCVHVAAKMTSHTLRIFLRQRFDIDVLTFEQHPVA